MLYNKGLGCLNTGVGTRMNLAKGTETLTDFTLVSQTLAEGKLSVIDVNQSVNEMNNETCKTVKKKNNKCSKCNYSKKNSDGI